jgi:hypothetical protein
MLNKLKSIVRDAMWLGIGTVAILGYVSYRAGKSIVADVPDMMDFSRDTYNQVKAVLSKSTAKPDVPNAKDYESYQEFEDAYRDAGFTAK